MFLKGLEINEDGLLPLVNCREIDLPHRYSANIHPHSRRQTTNKFPFALSNIRTRVPCETTLLSSKKAGWRIKSIASYLVTYESVFEYFLLQ